MAAFGSAIGGGQEIQAAMQRRGMGGGGAPAQSPASAGFNPATQVPAPANPTANVAPMQASTGNVATAMGMQENPESTIIIKALISRLQKLSQ